MIATTSTHADIKNNKLNSKLNNPNSTKNPLPLMVHPSLGLSTKYKRKRRTMEKRLPIVTDLFIQIMNI